MIHIHHSNQLEALAGDLLDSYESQDSHPFTPRTIITESPSLARWLRHQFCINDGIACLIDTPLPAAWLWNQARTMLNVPAEEDPLARERMQWLIHTALNDTDFVQLGLDMEKVTSYLKNDDTGLKCWQLSGRIADCFDRYQYYQPEKLIRQWSAGQDTQWQALLWRKISKDIDTHRIALMNDFLGSLNSSPDLSKLPQRLDLFSIHNLPQLLLDAYAAIAHHIPVHLWLLAPTPAYWADLASPRQMARKRLEEPENATLWDMGNPLLTQWGRQGQFFQDMLIELDTLETEITEFHQPGRNTLLQHIQADIFEAIDETPAIKTHINKEESPSIQIHICHSAMRECQVLHDTLLHCLKDNPQLQPEDILVMVPEISSYAPYIEAVFGQTAADGKIHLPYNLSDIALADEHPLVRAFLELLELPESRFTRTQILSLINIPEVQRRFGLVADDNAELAELFDELRVYWGLDGKDKARFKLPEIEENTWQYAFRRVMAGFALGDKEYYTTEQSGILPYINITAQNAERIARFFSLLHTLRDWSEKLQQPATADNWSDQLNDLLNAVFAEDPDGDSRLIRIRELLVELKTLNRTGHGEDTNSTLISPSVIRHWLSNALSTRTVPGRYYSGGITFCGMQPLRGVPFKVICLLGMQDKAFPRRQSAIEFDLMAEQWQRGYPDPTQEDRYLFLETLLAVRERFIISYTGRDNRSNKELQPCVLVQELLDYLDDRYLVLDKKPSEILTQIHSLQAFGRSNFSNPKDHAFYQCSFDTFWLETAKTLIRHNPSEESKDWPVIIVPLPDNFQRQITPQALARFFKHPVRYFVQQQLHLYEADDVEIIEDEPFTLNSLESWQILDLLITNWQQNKSEKNKQLIMGSGILPHGSLGEEILEKTNEEFTEILSLLNIETDITPPIKNLPIDINLKLAVANNTWQLSGRLNNVFEVIGPLQISASSYSLAKLMPLWIEHLCLHAGEHPQADTTLAIFKDTCKKINPVEPDIAREYLTDLLKLYEYGLSSPLSYMPKTSAKFMENMLTNNDAEQAIRDIQLTWKKQTWGNGYSGENEDFHASIILRRHNWKPDQNFAKYAQRILLPLQNSLESET